jgi:two-component system LytT family sensor kinase
MNLNISYPIRERSWNRKIFLHITGWTFFICYELGFLYYINQKLGPSLNYLIYYSLNIALFYSQVALLKNTFDHSRPAYWNGLYLFFVQLVLFTGCKLLADCLLAPAGFAPVARIQYALKFLTTDVIRGIYFCILALFYYNGANVANFRRKAAEAEKQELLMRNEKAELGIRLAETRNAYLQQQLNPHLLFNALNFIYNSVHQYSPSASRCVLLLSDIMRYSLESTAEDGKTGLNSEIEQVQNLIEINHYRYDQQLCLKTDFRGDFAPYRIIPLVLLTLTENLFKHGNLTNNRCPALLKLDLTPEGELLYYCSNLKRRKTEHHRISEIGLKNTRLRLDHVYGDAYYMEITETDTHFELNLKITL